MMTEFLNYGDFNVIRVNWFPGVIGTYGDATANSRIVGAEISFLIDRFRVRTTIYHVLIITSLSSKETRSMCISDHTQTIYFYLGLFL